jgi:hypothetical protein
LAFRAHHVLDQLLQGRALAVDDRLIARRRGIRRRDVDGNA